MAFGHVGQQLWRAPQALPSGERQLAYRHSVGHRIGVEQDLEGHQLERLAEHSDLELVQERTSCVDGLQLLRRQVTLRAYEAEPTAVPPRDRGQRVPHAHQLTRGRPHPTRLAQLAVDPFDLVGASGEEPLFEQGLGLQLQFDRAAVWQVEVPGGQQSSQRGHGLVTAERQQRPQALEEHRVVADEVDHGQVCLALGDTQASTELLEEDHAGLGRAQHHHAVDGGEVDALVEDVDRADRVELTLGEAS